MVINLFDNETCQITSFPNRFIIFEYARQYYYTEH